MNRAAHLISYIYVRNLPDPRRVNGKQLDLVACRCTCRTCERRQSLCIATDAYGPWSTASVSERRWIQFCTCCMRLKVESGKPVDGHQIAKEFQGVTSFSCMSIRHWGMSNTRQACWCHISAACEVMDGVERCVHEGVIGSSPQTSRRLQRI
eukprot:scaffold246_cov414-Prasinococcus_capsulatus_cf.AAC.7